VDSFKVDHNRTEIIRNRDQDVSDACVDAVFPIRSVTPTDLPPVFYAHVMAIEALSVRLNQFFPVPFRIAIFI
jgi:hypothetical protein